VLEISQEERVHLEQREGGGSEGESLIRLKKVESIFRFVQLSNHQQSKNLCKGF